MARMKALQNIYYHRSTYQEGDEFAALDTEVKGLVDQGFAEVIEEAPESPNQPGKEEAPVELSEKPLAKMNRTELEAYATNIGMTELEQYGTKNQLIDAIDNHK